MGKELIIPRDEIIKMQAAELSVMPFVLDNQISPSEMADLLAFIKNEQKWTPINTSGEDGNRTCIIELQTKKQPFLIAFIVARAGLEPATFGLWAQRDTTSPPRDIDCKYINFNNYMQTIKF